MISEISIPLCVTNAQWAKQAVDVSVLISVKNIWLLDNREFQQGFTTDLPQIYHKSTKDLPKIYHK